MDFVGTERVTGEALALRIQEVLIKYDLDLQHCQGQGYDGSSNMAARCGVQGLIMGKNSKALYVHCNAHILNVQACTVSSIRIMNHTVTYFFRNSPKRQMFLEQVIDKCTKVVKVKDLCRTHWIYRHESLLKMYCTFSFIYSFVVTMNCMSVIKPVSIKLQYKTNYLCRL